MIIKNDMIGGSDDVIRTRTLPECNYKAVFFRGKTLRIALDPTKEIKELTYPEFYDVKITNKCEGGCKWCYQNSIKEGMHADNAVEKIETFFGSMSEDQRPFQVAIGGGEPTLHPGFEQVLRSFYNLGIMPNYTTNGMFTKDDVRGINRLLNYTQMYCGGVAVSCHPHLERYWKNAFTVLSNAGIHTNFHIIISDLESIDYFLSIYDTYLDKTEYFVLLPYVSQGRAIQKNVEVEALFKVLKNDVQDVSKVAFGAGFHGPLKEDNFCHVSLYDPEAFSKYLDLIDMNLYRSSFDTEVLANVS